MMADELRGSKLADLPGIIELLKDQENLDVVNSFEDVIFAYLQHIKNASASAARLEVAEDDWSKLKGVDRLTYEGLVNGEETLFAVCTGLFKGKMICSDFHRFNCKHRSAFHVSRKSSA